MSRSDKALRRATDVLRVVARLEADGRPDLATAYRIERTRRDPMLFALLYLRKHLTDPDGKVTLSRVHLDWAATAKGWADGLGEPMADRRAEVAPREMGKSTWWFLILPMWGAAHGHVKFAAAFADAGTQAETHLASFKSELDNNPLIRADFPDLVSPKTRGRGTVEADRVSLYHAKNDFVFAAAGMDSRNLGLKVGDRRPDLIVLDDIEPHESAYSADLARKRLDTLVSAILPLNVRAHVVLVGTVTMSGSIIHQIVRYGRGEIDDSPGGNQWVGDERITTRHYGPFVTQKDGERRSIWPSKWPLDWLTSIEHTRQFAKNYLNDPLGSDGDYWTMDDFIPLTPELDAAITHEVISVDPAVSTKKSSDFTAIAAVGWSRVQKRCALYESRKVKLSGSEVRRTVLGFIERALLRGHVVIVIVESNQGGELWKEVFHDLPVRVKTYTTGAAAKHVRAAEALHHYQRRRVEHAPGNRETEGEMVAFPRAPHDDLVDAVGAGVRYFLTPKKPRPKAGGAVQAYA